MTKILSNKSDIDLDYPICRPSLDLDFTQEVLDPRITFTRGSIGTRVNRNRLIETVSANQPRFDYDPVTGECKGLLIEESRTNLWTYSDSPNLAYYDPTFVAFSINSLISPDGTQNADKIMGLSGKSNAQISQGVTITSGATVTGSVYIKYGGFNRVELVMLSNNNTTPYARATFDPSTGTITTAVSTANGGTNASANIVFVGNGWYRCNVTVTYPAVTAAGMRINATSSTGGISEGSLGVYVWGAQVEAGAFPTSYIPTTASTVTRSADLASMTGTNFSSWYNSSEGTVSTSYQQNSNTSGINFGVFSLTASTSNNNNLIDYFVGNATSPVFRIVYNGVQAPYEYAGTSYANIKNKGAFSFTTNKFTKCINGTFYSTSLAFPITSGIKIPTVNTLVLGPYWAGLKPLNGTISRLTYYPRALKPNQLQYLTQ